MRRKAYLEAKKELKRLRVLRGKQRVYGGLKKLMGGARDGLDKAKVGVIKKLKRARKKEDSAEVEKQVARLEAIKASSPSAVVKAWATPVRISNLLRKATEWYRPNVIEGIPEAVSTYISSVLPTIEETLPKILGSHGGADTEPAPMGIADAVAARPEFVAGRDLLLKALSDEYTDLVLGATGGRPKRVETILASGGLHKVQQQGNPDLPLLEPQGGGDDIFLSSLSAPPSSSGKRGRSKDSLKSGDTPPTKKRKRNRPSQRARRALAEAKYGKQAKHLAQ